ncbi:MAG: ATP synthase F1 subunit gamma [Chloroflexi bacterium]|nr:ATP synthase F1 subunit gamma [Chloroflexota bacterium]
MPSTQELRRRIRSVANTAKITRAMQMIAASKMRRAQDAVVAGRPYSEHINSVLSHLAAIERGSDDTSVQLLEARDVQMTGIVLITPDRGLAGGLVTNLTRTVERTIREIDSPVTVVAVGRKGRDFTLRTGNELKAVFQGIGDYPTVEDTRPISNMVIELFESAGVDRVLLAYSRFVNTVVQAPAIDTLIPVEPADLSADEAVGYIYEPDPITVLEKLLPRYIEMEVYHAILEAIASEHSARMVAMKNATDAANDLIEDLTLELNKARQEAITSEMLDIVGGVEALK